MKRSYCLIADDNPSMCLALHGLLGNLFSVVMMVADVGCLVAIVDWLNPELAVIDVSLPADRDNVLEVVRSRFPSLTFIALSQHDASVAVERVLAMGARAFVLKRAAATDLLPAVA